MFKNISINQTQVIVLAIVTAVLSLSAWSFSHAAGTEISMCVKQSGVSYIIGTGFAKQACSSNEQLVTFNIEGPQGPQGIQGPIGPQGPEGSGAKLYDANDQVIGYITSTAPFPDSFEILEKNLGVIVAVSVNGSFGPHLGVSTQSPIYFESSDCSGQAYHGQGLSEATAFYASTNVYQSAESLYTLDKTIPKDPTDVAFYSHASPGGCTSSPVSPIAFGNRNFPMKDVRPILDLHVRPFHIGS